MQVYLNLLNLFNFFYLFNPLNLFYFFNLLNLFYLPPNIVAPDHRHQGCAHARN